MDADTITHYAEVMKEEGNVFPPLVVFYDGTDHWLSDGFHRHAAAKKAGLGSLKARYAKELVATRSSMLSERMPSWPAPDQRG